MLGRAGGPLRSHMAREVGFSLSCLTIEGGGGPMCWLAGTAGAGEGAPLPGWPTPAVAQGLAGILAFPSV